jgi:hypothetical protein
VHSIQTVEGVTLEIETTTSGLPPGDRSGMSLNSCATFWRVNNGPWHGSPMRSHHETVKNLPAMVELLVEWDLIDRV